MTTYVVLVKKEDTENEWIQFTAILARSARAAIREAVTGDENPYKEGMFVAVPARSWKTEVPKAETKTTLRFS